jgi:hypothetical protein
MSVKRPYVSPLRQQAAARTRAEILRCATDLFAERGYGRVTVADIASATGVSSKTVFAVDQGVVASDYEVTMRQVLTLRTPEAVLETLAQGTRAGNEGQFRVHEAIRAALPVHENGAALWERATSAYRDALRTAAHHLHTLTPSPDLPEQETADLLWFWFGPSGWRTLVAENGWSWERAETFLRHTAVATLLSQGSAPEDRPPQ